MRYLAIDHGQKRTGLAVSDASETIVSPHSIIETQSPTELLRRILVVIDEEKIQAVVIGLPYNMDGTEGPRAQKVKEFAQLLSEKITIPILYHDERLSSFGAEQLMVGMELTRKKKKKRLDAIAAAEILKSFLDSQ
jgi:putative Holliday junction resolvase